MQPVDQFLKELKRLFRYDSSTGEFIRLTKVGQFAIGSVAGTTHSNGYRAIVIKGRSYLVHRLAWIYTHGEWPKVNIDHKNRVRSDNWIDNLRLATQKQNNENKEMQSNNTSGIQGVSWHIRGGKWRADICSNRKSKFLGLFDTIAQASAAYKAAADELFTHHTS